MAERAHKILHRDWEMGFDAHGFDATASKNRFPPCAMREKSVNTVTKKDILFLLVPCIYLVALVGLSLSYANDFLPDPRQKQSTQRKISALVQQVHDGEFSSEPDRLVGYLTNSWLASDGLHETLAYGHAKLARIIGYGVLFGVVLQMYVIFRVRARMKKDHS